MIDQSHERLPDTGPRVRLRGKLEQASLEDIYKFNLGKFHRMAFLFNFPGPSILLGCIAVIIMGLMSSDWFMAEMGTLAGVITAVILRLSDTRHRREKQLNEANDRQAEWITASIGGVEEEAENGTTTFHPWTEYKTSQEGKNVTVLQGDGYGKGIFLPTVNLSEADRATLRYLIATSLSLKSSKSSAVMR